MLLILLLHVLGIALILIGLVPAIARGQSIKVTLLGTGCPPPLMDRFGPSIPVEAGEPKLVFDGGHGALQRLRQLNVPWQDVDGVFLTHLHSDHLVGFPDLWLTGWIVPPGRRTPLRVWGPKGTRNMMAHLREAYQFDIGIRIRDDHVTPDGALLLTEEVREGVVYDVAGVKVIAFEVDRAPIRPAFGYRVECRRRNQAPGGTGNHKGCPYMLARIPTSLPAPLHAWRPFLRAGALGSQPEVPSQGETQSRNCGAPRTQATGCSCRARCSRALR